MALGTATTAILLGLGGAAAGVGASKLMGGKSPSFSTTPLPQAPSVADAAAKGEETARRRRATTTQTVYSSPLGVAGEANIARKTLLGQ